MHATRKIKVTNDKPEDEPRVVRGLVELYTRNEQPRVTSTSSNEIENENSGGPPRSGEGTPSSEGQ